MTEILRAGGAISCHAWNGDKSRVALSPNSNEIHIYKKEGAEWVREHTLAEHDQTVNGIDWAPKSNRIVSCSHDRNAYVWTVENGKWQPVLVILRISRAATAVKWSPEENKFAVASSAKCVAVCFFDKDNNWWVSRHIKKHKSTVLSLAWHPNNVLLLTGSSDFKARVFSAAIKNVDKTAPATPFGDKTGFGEMLAEYLVGGWVHNVVWSPSGNSIAFVAHDSSITFVDISRGAPGNLQIVKVAFLPLYDLLFTSENQVIAGGHDCSPLVFNTTGDGSWAFSNLIAEKKDPVAQKTGGTKQAFELFKNKVEVGANTNVQTLLILHQNCIIFLVAFESSGKDVKKFITGALDGKMVVWNSA